MKKLKILAWLAIAGPVGCATNPPAQTPGQPVDNTTQMGQQPEPDDGSIESSLDNEQQEQSESENHVEPQLPPPEPERPPCHTFDKSRCPVTPGCEWYEKAGAGMCRDQ